MLTKDSKFKNWGVKRRYIPECNYNAIWSNLKTIRLGEGQAKELSPEYSEFYDVSLGNKCNTGKCPFCLTPDTLIQTDKGNIPINKININDLVYSFNEETGDTELKNVDQIFERDYEGEIIEIELENKILRLTPNHKVYTLERAWVEAKNLQISDTLLKFLNS